MNTHCSVELLQSALIGELPSSQEIELQQHLDSCDACSEAMEEMVRWTEWREEDASLLTEDELDEIRHAREECAVDFTVEHLAPSDRAGALGRLGEFEILDVIGRGGMGVVLKGIDEKLNRYVAIKVLAPHLAQISLARKRFAREAQAAAAVVHPNVLAIHQVQPSGPLPFLVMPLVAGESVAERLADRGTLELNEILRIGMQAAAGLAAAHEQGLVHRDVKPANILLEKGIERAVLTDFGLARAADDVTLTRWGIIAGTPQYMSPEQARGESLDGRSDLFSLGCVLYEMATGVSPFRTDSLLATMRRLVDDDPRSIGSLNPELPAWFNGIVERLLEKDPAKRFPSAKELSELLEKCLAHVQQPANVPLPKEVPQPKSTTIGAKRGSGHWKPGWRAVVTALALIGFGAIGVFMMATAEPSDISGEWTGDGWDKVTIKRTDSAAYSGTYTDTFGKEPGTIELKWSRIEQRYNGKWSEGKDRFGKISVRRVGDEIRGAWTTNRKSNVNPGTPELADLLWVHPKPYQGPEPKWAKFSLDAPWTNLEFSPVMEIRLPAVPPEVNDNQTAHVWAQEHGADFVPFLDHRGHGHLLVFNGWEMDGHWDWSPKQVADYIADYARNYVNKHSPGDSDAIDGSITQRDNEWADKPVFFVKVRNGVMGVIQITGVEAAPFRVTIRVKMLSGDPPSDQRDTASLSLHDRVTAFNERARQDPIGKGQPPLTEDEVIASIRRLSDAGKANISAEGVKELQAIADSGNLPLGGKIKWQIIEDTTLAGVDSERFRTWVIELRRFEDRIVDIAEGKSTGSSRAFTVVHTIRRRLLWQIDENGNRIELPELKVEPANKDSTPLAAAITQFNAAHKSVLDIPQPPLTEDEVVAAIRYWKARRNDAPVTNGEFAEFQKIAETRQLPRGAEFELLTQFQNDDGSELTAWSIRIRMQKEGMTTATYAFAIRDQDVRFESSAEKFAANPVQWGAASQDGLQAGIRLIPQVESIADGPRVSARTFFYFRNTGKRPLAVKCPRLMIHPDYKKILVTDASGREVRAEQEEVPGVPMRWFEVQLQPNAVREVNGPTILFGQGDRKTASTAIRVSAEPPVHVQFVLPNVAKSDGEPLTTGVVVFSIDKTSSPDLQTAFPKGTVELQSRSQGAHSGDEKEAATGTTATQPPFKRVLQIDTGLTGHNVRVAYSPDGKLIAVASSNPTMVMMGGGRIRVDNNWRPGVNIFNAESGKKLVSLPLSTTEEDAVLAATERFSHFEPTALAFSPDGKVVAVGTSIGQVKLFDSQTGKLTQTLDDEKARLADKKTPENWRSLKRAMGSVQALAFSPNGKSLATIGGSFADFAERFDSVRRLGGRATGAGRLKLWDATSGALKNDLVGHNDFATAIAFSPDGRLLASAGRWATANEFGNGVLIWNAETGQQIHSLIHSNANGGVKAIAFSPDSKMLVLGTQRFDESAKAGESSSTGGVSLVNASSGTEQWLATVPGWAKPVAFSPDESRIAVLCGGHSIRFLDVATGTVQDEIAPADASPDTKWDDFAFSTKGVMVIGSVDKKQNARVEVWSAALAANSKIDAVQSGTKKGPAEAAAIPVDQPDNTGSETYQSATYLQKKLAARIPDGVWGKARAGLRLALIVRDPFNTEWNELPAGTPIPTSVKIRVGDHISCQLVVENVSDRAFNLSGFTYSEIGRTVEVLDAKGHPVSVELSANSNVPVPSRWRLLPGERYLLQMPPINFLTKSLNSSEGYNVTVPPGEYTLRCSFDFGIDKHSKDIVDSGSLELTGSLSTAALNVKVLDPQ